MGAFVGTCATFRGAVGHDLSQRARHVGPCRHYRAGHRWGDVARPDYFDPLCHGGASSERIMGHDGHRSGVLTDRHALGSVRVPARAASALGGGEQQALRGGRIRA